MSNEIRSPAPLTNGISSNSTIINFDTQVFEVEKSNLQNTRITSFTFEQPLLENEVVLKVDKFALTANNISYGVAGYTLGYWRFFVTELATDEH
ncbi:MAG: hypothetical protein ACI89T_001812 [Cognaticolwellia sp.]|jgi:hypothetical protein